MGTALAEWTPERPDEPGFYWWMRPGEPPRVVEVLGDWWAGTAEGDVYDDEEMSPPPGALWWPVRLDPPPVG